MAGFDQFQCILAIDVEPLGLVVGTFVPVEIEPFHGIQNRLDGCFGGAFDIGVFDSEDEFPSAIAREKPVEQGGPRAAYVQVSGRTGRKTGNNRFHELICSLLLYQNCAVEKISATFDDYGLTIVNMQKMHAPQQIWMNNTHTSQIQARHAPERGIRRIAAM